MKGIFIALAFIIMPLHGALKMEGHADWNSFIFHLLRHYKRPITVLEIGANKERLSFEIAQRFDATCVMIDWQGVEELVKECLARKSENIIVLGQDISVEELQHMSECEHFDVVIVADILEQFGQEIADAFAALSTMGDYLIIKHIPTWCTQDIHTKSNLGHCSFFPTQKKELQRTAWVKERCMPGTFKIKSTFEEKKLYKRNAWFGAPWIRGINLYTFKECRGQYPPVWYICRKLKEFVGSHHNDLWIGNMILQGRHIKLIDFGDRRRNADPQFGLERCLKHFEVRA